MFSNVKHLGVVYIWRQTILDIFRSLHRFCNRVGHSLLNDHDVINGRPFTTFQNLLKTMKVLKQLTAKIILKNRHEFFLFTFSIYFFSSFKVKYCAWNLHRNEKNIQVFQYFSRIREKKFLKLFFRSFDLKIMYRMKEIISSNRLIEFNIFQICIDLEQLS